MDRLLDVIRGYDRLAVAYSGGADSALVLAAAARALGPGDVLAVTAVSESLASGELTPARAFADSLAGFADGGFEVGAFRSGRLNEG